MAEIIMMKHPSTGVIKKGFYGFSWTTLCFGGIPALCRGDILTGVLVCVATFFTFGIAGIIWAFIYNKRYTVALVEQGYQFADSETKIALAQQSLCISTVNKENIQGSN